MAFEPEGIVYEAAICELLTIIPLVALTTAAVPVVAVGRPKYRHEILFVPNGGAVEKVNVVPETV